MTGPAVRARSDTLGIAALAIAVGCIAVMSLWALLSWWVPALQLAGGPGVVPWPLWVDGVVMLVALALGVVAALTGRGRWYGLAAVLLAVLGNALLPLAILTILPPGRG